LNDDILHKLQERVKELTALHATARILQESARPVQDVMNDIVALLPPAWQFPDITSARIRFQDREAKTPGFAEAPWRQSARFITDDGTEGVIDVFYRQPRPPADEGPFLKEERDLIDSLAEMLRSYFDHVIADESLRRAHADLERLVDARTAELRQANAALESQIAEYRKAELRIARYQMQLRRLASELSLAEARERRTIASDLHDHIGQALAFIKMNVSQFRGDAIFCGFEDRIDQILSLLNQTIQYTRNLTFEISPPILYELGLQAALEWLGDQFQKKQNMPVEIVTAHQLDKCDDDIQVTLFKSVQELLTNAVKHAHAGRVKVLIDRNEREIQIVVTDDGCGFDTSILDADATNRDVFGLFNIRERLNYFGGRMNVVSGPGRGTEVTLLAPCGGKGSPHEN
ncbi:MAG TPA: sensor histidine kinase, partial [Candidatus Acidoferrum sp.]|nr:sensor histidine kinase [Candidatus Acidoferrum sp.]